MKKVKITALALVFFSCAAMADDFPPFFPNATGTAEAAPQQEGNVYTSGNGLYVNESNTVTQQQIPPQTSTAPQGIDPLIIGSWKITNGGEYIIFTMESSGVIKMNMNGSTKGIYYRTSANNLILYKDAGLQSVQKIIPYTISGNTLTLVIDGTPTPFQKQNGGFEASGPAPAPVHDGQLTGSYSCTVPGNEAYQFRHEFAGNTYKVFVSSPANNQRESLIETGYFQVSGNNFHYQIFDSVNPQQKGLTGTNQIFITAFGYEMRNPSFAISCRK